MYIDNFDKKEYDNLMHYLNKCREFGQFSVPITLDDCIGDCYKVSKSVLEQLYFDSMNDDYFVRGCSIIDGEYSNDDLWFVEFVNDGELMKRNYLFLFFVMRGYDGSKYFKLMDYGCDEKELKIKELKDEDIPELINSGYAIKKVDNEYIISW